MKAVASLLAISLFCYVLFSGVAPAQESKAITVMSLNIYGWKTMPKHSHDYALLINRHKVDILGIQEGVDDWQLQTSDLENNFPINYQRATDLHNALGECWQHKFQIFINHCQGSRFIASGRFDLTDGPNATRTGEYAVIEKANQQYLFVNVHWEHDSIEVRMANAKETAALLNNMAKHRQILLGDFNSQCDGKEVRSLQNLIELNLVESAGIDCLFVKGLSGEGTTIEASPSDHPAIVATLSIK
jgi:endonuclease/exonuclease/phosphatase family metal-dependent hydrolase